MRAIAPAILVLGGVGVKPNSSPARGHLGELTIDKPRFAAQAPLASSILTLYSGREQDVLDREAWPC
jgi:hypothetical protein